MCGVRETVQGRKVQVVSRDEIKQSTERFIWSMAKIFQAYDKVE